MPFGVSQVWLYSKLWLGCALAFFRVLFVSALCALARKKPDAKIAWPALAKSWMFKYVGNVEWGDLQLGHHRQPVYNAG